MFAILCSSLLAFVGQTPTPSQTEKATDSTSLDGTWTVLCLEKDGQPVSELKDKQVTIKNNVITCHDNQSHFKTMKIQFEPHGMVQVWEAKDGTTGANQNNNANTNETTYKEAKSGTFVMAKDFLAICVHGDKDKDGTSRNNGTNGTNSNQSSSSYRPSNKSVCTVVLKRMDGK
ncbi:hypothetical protein KIH39_06150 [Telmatocola sphagniphila]|uniref:TIGR03067 domain-containing protein n=1 Tax=Telmatocola sphagniphila TaxID=1123043 RepID=A0A8E6EW11_9BACT|nr:hypothetical protein [Telmatocola sphagniphila]QVL33490.1 hypothetical protein KIH39_06150 [Telmatocola sphagniphila]